MADKKITELTAASSVADADLVEIVQTGTNKKSAFSVIKTYILSALAFTDLVDTPSDYSGDADKRVKVRHDETGLTFIDDTFLTLQDTPNDYTGESDKLVKVKTDETGLTFIDPPTPGASAFTDLTDVPSSYAGEGDKLVAVKATEDGLEFITAPSGSFTPGDLTAAGTDGIAVTGGTDAVNGTGTSIAQHVADTSHNGYLTSTDWNTFNGKAAPDAHYVTTQAESGLSAEFNLGGLTSGLLKQTVSTGVATPAIAIEGSDYLDGSRIDDTAYNAGTWDGDTTHAPSKNAIRDKIESMSLVSGSKAGVGFSIGRTSGLTTGKVKGFFVCPYAATISAFNFVIDAGTATVKTWKKATGTAKPTSSDSINTSGVSISSNTALRSTTLTDFTTTTVTANDIFAFNIEALTGSPTELMFLLELTKT